MSDMTREALEAFILSKYNVLAEHPWDSAPSFAVFRHQDGRKWFAVIMTIPKCKLGINEDSNIDIVNLKCPEELICSFRQEDGIYPAYHMNKAHWLSVSLDSTVDDETLSFLLEISYVATRRKKHKLTP